MRKITPYKYSWNFFIPRICTVTRDWKERWRKNGANKVLEENWTNDRSLFNVNVVFDRGRFEFRLRTSAYRSMRLVNLYLWTDRTRSFWRNLLEDSICWRINYSTDKAGIILALTFSGIEFVTVPLRLVNTCPPYRTLLRIKSSALNLETDLFDFTNR